MFKIIIYLTKVIDVNAICPIKGYTALIAAVYNKDISMIDLLLHSEELDFLTNYYDLRYDLCMITMKLFTN